MNWQGIIWIAFTIMFVQWKKIFGHIKIPKQSNPTT